MRLRLTQYRGSALTDDTIEALRRLEMRAAHLGNVSLDFEGPARSDMTWGKMKLKPGPTKQKPHTSMRLGGREVQLTLRFNDDPLADPETQVARERALLWTLAIPLGFVAWDRYPVESDTASVFHYFGPWVHLYDHLLSEGRGEVMWPSMCAAAQLDVGTWNGNRQTERFVQAQLHRIGLNPGPVDGIIAERTTATLQAAGLHSHSLKDVAGILAERESATVVREERTTGHFVLPNREFHIEASGGIKTTRTPTGAAVTVDGPGRLIIDVKAVNP